MPLSPMALHDAFRRGLFAHGAGDLAEAERLYRLILGDAPDHPQALHYLGVVHAQRGAYEDACRLIERSLRHDRSAEAYSHLGNALRGLRRLEDALGSYDQAIALNPGYADAHYNRANALRQLGRWREALASYDRAITLKPRDAETHYARGALLKELGRFEAALESYDQVIAIKPDHADMWNSRGNVLMELGRPEEAVASYDRAIALKPDYAAAHSNRGNALKDLRRFDEALLSYDRATAIRPEFVEAHYNRGRTLTDMGRFEDGLASYERAVALKPDYAEAYMNRGTTLVRLKRLDEALASYAQALRFRRDYAEAHWNEGVCRLLLGDFPRGWEKYEWRWDIPTARPRRHTRYREWRGERVEGRLLAWSEQGLGDHIFFAGMVPDLIRMADHLIVHVDPRLVGLFRRSFPDVEVVDDEFVGDVNRIDRTIPMGSVGRYVRRSLGDFPGVAGYLRSDPGRRDALRRRLDDGSLLVGISWISKNPASGTTRTIPLARWDTLLALPGVRYVDLQYGDTFAERASAERRCNVSVAHAEDVDNYSDIDGLAALITACDLVITIDNTTAHLAAALGRPTWVLLPFVPEWRWLLDRDDSPWYPTVWLFRQPASDDWDTVLERVRAALWQRRAEGTTLTARD